MHLLTGPAMGLDAVTQGTVDTLTAYADRVVIAEDVVWSEDVPGVFYSSHRINSRSTHFGDEVLIGGATMRGAGVTTIADCVVERNRIIEEWLVRDNTRALWQIDVDPRAVAAAQAEIDLAGNQARHDWRRAAIAVVREEPSIAVAPEHPAALPAHMLEQAFAHDLYGDAATVLSPAVELRWPSNRRGYGRGYWVGCVMQLRAMLHQAAFRLEHVAARPLPQGDIAVALRWSLAGVHGGIGPWGPPSGRELLVMAVSHYRLRGGAIVEDVTVFDEVAVLRQIAGGLGA